ncbi:MAG: lytic transglycosylase domain-containing protein [Bdellovibrionota bacterium]
MAIWNCRTWVLRPLILLVCLILTDQTSRGLSSTDQLCTEDPKLSHELFLCNVSYKKSLNREITKENILTDFDLRVSSEFKVDDRLRNRVGFWFDIYTVYGSDQKVLHLSDYPWIIFKVLDFKEIMSRPKARWVNQTKVDLLTKLELVKLRVMLSSLSKKVSRKNFSAATLNEEEKATIDQLQTLPGSLKKNLVHALKDVRVQTGQRDYYLQGLKESQDYMKTMENVFLENRLPIELARLPMVESSFNSKATSKAGAAGVWQFMLGTGKKFLMINDHIDERRSPFKSTEAAATLLKENYLLFQNWPLALTAYNHGPGGVRLAMRKMKSRNLGEIIATYETKNFSFATRNYYSEFLGALYAERYSNEIFGNLKKADRQEYEKVELLTNLRPDMMLSWLDLSSDEFVKMNPDLKKALRSNTRLPKGFALYLAPDMAFQFRSLQKKYQESLKKSVKTRRIADL